MAADARNPLTGGRAPLPSTTSRTGPGRPAPSRAGAAAQPAAAPPDGARPPGPPAADGPDGSGSGTNGPHPHAPEGPPAPAADRAPARAADGPHTHTLTDPASWAPEGPPPGAEAGPLSRAPLAAPEPLPLPDTAAAHDIPHPLIAHGCWYPSADPSGRHVAFICDRAGVPQLWTGPVDGPEAQLLDSDPDPVIEVSWSPDGRWIAYTTAPEGGEHTRVLCVRPDGSGRRILAGAEPGSSAHLGCWRHDGSAVAVTVAEPTPAGVEENETDAALSRAGAGPAVSSHPPGWAARDGRALLLGGAPPGPPARSFTIGPGRPAAADDRTGRDQPPPLTLSTYLVDPESASAPVFLSSERGAATLRVCDVSRDGRLALLRRGPRGRREALVVRTDDLRVTCTVPVADGDPWIGGFAPDGRTLWLRSDHGREFAALYAVRLDPHGGRQHLTVAAERADCGLELLALDHDGRGAVLSWNARGVSELEILTLEAATGTSSPSSAAGRNPAPRTPEASRPAGPGASRAVALPHEVVTRVAPTRDPDAPVVALSGSQRRPGVWWLPQGTPLRTPWSSRDEDVAPGSRTPVRPVAMRPVARDGLTLGGWYYRAPGRSPGEPAPCVVHLHGGPEEQERPEFSPVYHELLGRGLDVFAPDVRGSSGYGRSYVDADLGRGRFAAIEDVADCAAHVVLAGLADPRRLAVMGRSYGGYLTMASLVWHPELFRTGVAVCGMSDFATFFAGTEPWIAQSAAHKYGHPERDRDLLRALSPMSRIDELRAPVLAVHGEHDTNVPPGESEQFVRAARERGVEAELLVLHHEGHDFRRADNRRLFRRAAADWIERHLTV
ncbi:prolyl oligopeptidase family serine peptidase [Streptomyces sp. PRKS01-65]|nr:prolyl oligopeptidase family serine peptidase [Streptomyces harenosi]NEY32348.1 prolyl oligopeptidase family serine peptidase [Streptomyces harenosi]